MTVDECLRKSGLPQHEARQLLAHALGVSQSWLLAHGSEPSPGADELFARRKAGEPLAYITGRCEFFGRSFACNPSTLIPRPRTELLVDEAISKAEAIFRAQEKPCPVRILELGTGTGCIAITIALELHQLGIPADILATDVSVDALALAETNWRALSNGSPFQRIQFLQSNLLEQVPAAAPYDMLVANLPYVEEAWEHATEAPREVVAYEPASALYAGADGLDCYLRLAEELRERAPIRSLLLECADQQATALREYYPGTEITPYGISRT